MTVGYEPDKTGLYRTRQVGDITVTLRAEKIRQERTGTHGLIEIQANGVRLAWTNGNLERDEDRVRLSNSAFKHLKGRIHSNGKVVDYPAEYLKKDLDDFCHGLWEAYTSLDMAHVVAGELEASPPTQVVGGFVLEGGGTIVFAPPGRGKSWTLLTMAVSVDAGVNRVFKIEQRRVLFINLERSEASIRNRLGAVNRALGLSAERPLLMINARGKSLADVIDAARASVAEHDAGCVFLDSISRAGAGDLTENGPMNRIVDMLNGLGGTWTGIAHAPRASDDHAYGSIMLDAGADVMVKLLSQEKPGLLGIGLKVVKENDIGSKPFRVFALEFAGPLGLVGARIAKSYEFPEIESGALPPASPEDVVAKYLGHVGQATATQVGEQTGLNRSTISRLFNESPRFRKARREGNEVFYELA